jgi:hypothetical protein
MAEGGEGIVVQDERAPKQNSSRGRCQEYMLDIGGRKPAKDSHRQIPAYVRSTKVFWDCIQSHDRCGYTPQAAWNPSGIWMNS